MIKSILNYYNDLKKNKILYLQIGAFDGVTGDIIYPYIRKYKWKGVRVEPVPFHFNKIKNLHNNDPKTVCVNMAVSELNGVATLYSVKQSPDNPPFAEQLSSFKKEVILKHSQKIPDLINKIIEFEVPCISYPDLIRKYSLSGVDLVYIDTEGYDYEIFKQIDFVNDKPEVLIFENKHLEKKYLEELLLKMHRLNYAIIRDGQDTLLINRDTLRLLFRKSSISKFFRKLIAFSKGAIKMVLMRFF